MADAYLLPISGAYKRFYFVPDVHVYESVRACLSTGGLSSALSQSCVLDRLYPCRLFPIQEVVRRLPAAYFPGYDLRWVIDTWFVLPHEFPFLSALSASVYFIRYYGA